MTAVKEAKKVSIRSGFKPPRKIDVTELVEKRGTVADVLSDVIREHLGDDALSCDMRPGQVDVELSTDTGEHALSLSADWQSVIPLIQAGQKVELGVARHVSGGNFVFVRRAAQ